MRIGFAGTPEFASTALQALLDAGYETTLVLTQPDRPAGRGMKLQASPVKQLAVQHQIPVLQPHSLRLDGKYPEEALASQKTLEAAELDFLIVAAYGLILPQWVLETPKLGCLNIHASLLPRWRGAAPIHRAIEAGDTLTGITIMQMDEGLDTGDMLLIESLAIQPDDTTASLHDTLATLGGKAIVQALQELANQTLKATPQPSEGVCYAHKISRSESWLDWQQPAEALHRKVRAFNPFPAAQTSLRGQNIKIWQAQTLPTAKLANPNHLPAATPGQILQASSQGIDVACGNHTVLRLHELQRAGSKRLTAGQWLNGFDMQAGEIMQTPDDIANSGNPA